MDAWHRSVDMSKPAVESSEPTDELDAAADFAQELPVAITEQSGGAGPHSRLERFDSLARGESSDGIRHSRWVIVLIDCIAVVGVG